jgi:murein DD-endopeptidase MepM/ murein hydrolase activator NlpD
MTPVPSTRPPGALRSVAAFAVFLLSMTGLAVAAKPLAAHREHVAGRAAEQARRTADAAQVPPTAIVWRGADIDGDGAPDFINPTGRAPRGHDAFGDGHFGARRDGGARSHEGVDYAAGANQAVKAPISGRVTKIGYAYGGDSSLRFVQITNPAIGYVARAFYVDPTVAVGDMLRLGDVIGTVASLQAHYPGITDHVHLEIMAPSGHRLDATGLIRPRTVVLRG